VNKAEISIQAEGELTVRLSEKVKSMEEYSKEFHNGIFQQQVVHLHEANRLHGILEDIHADIVQLEQDMQNSCGNTDFWHGLGGLKQSVATMINGLQKVELRWENGKYMKTVGTAAWKQGLEATEEPCVTNWRAGNIVASTEAADGYKLSAIDKAKGVLLSCAVCALVTGMLLYLKTALLD